MKTFTVVLRDKTRFTLEKETAAEANAWLRECGYYRDGPKKVRFLYDESEALPPPQGCRL
jgi:hypothetical protein